MSSSRRNNFEQQQTFHRQATILRKNLSAFDYTLHQRQQEDWPRMLGRLNAAWNQASNLNYNGIDDVLEHFVYLPKRCPANPQDVPFFLSTRLTDTPPAKAAPTISDTKKDDDNESEQKGADDEVSQKGIEEDPTKTLRIYEEYAAKMAVEFEDSMIRY